MYMYAYIDIEVGIKGSINPKNHKQLLRVHGKANVLVAELKITTTGENYNYFESQVSVYRYLYIMS